jgi:polyhydroxybutyrate depolymerase
LARSAQRSRSRASWLLASWLPLAQGCFAPPELGQADYADLALPVRCESGSRAGRAGASDGYRTASGIGYSVRTPRNYDPARAHPLLVVFAAAGQGPTSSERFSGLTGQATGRGWIVAYVEHRPLALRTFQAMGEIAAHVARSFCVDERRVALAGHSDGATTASAVAFLGVQAPRPFALVLSAAGIRGEDLSRYACPAPLSVMVVHSGKDTLFPPPAYGEGAFEWWARCGQCTGHAQPAPDNCVAGDGCARGVQVRYCQVNTPHADWPGLDRQMLEFLDAAEPRSS